MMEKGNLVGLLFSLVCLAALLGKAQMTDKRKKRGSGLKDAKPLPELPLLLLFTVIALGVRLYGFGSIPAGFNQDGAMAAVDAKALADYGTDRYGMRLPAHFTAWGYGQMSVLMSYCMAPLIRLFGLNPVTARLPSLLWSLAGLACIYGFSRKAFGRMTALVIFAFAAIDPWHITQSRWALDCNLYPHVFLLGLWLLLAGAEGKRWALYLSMPVFGLCMYCYGVSLYTLPPFLLAACAWLLATKRVKWGEAFLCAGLYLLIAWPFLLTMAVNAFGWETISLPFITIPYFPGSVRSGDILLFSNDIPRQLLANIKTTARVVFLQRQDLIWNDVPGFGTIFRFSLPFALLGVGLTWRRRKTPGGALLLLFFCAGLLCGILTNGVNVNRINLVFYPMVIFTGLGLDFTVRKLRVLRYGVIALYLAAFLCFTATYFGSYADQMSYAFFADFGSAVASVKDTDAEKLYITADSQYTGAWNVSEILTLFWHETDARYYQGDTPEGEAPFREKYVFASMNGLQIDPDENAVYVLRQRDRSLFDPALFTFTDFGDYCVARPK